MLQSLIQNALFIEKYDKYQTWHFWYYIEAKPNKMLQDREMTKFKLANGSFSLQGTQIHPALFFWKHNKISGNLTHVLSFKFRTQC